MNTSTKQDSLAKTEYLTSVMKLVKSLIIYSKEEKKLSEKLARNLTGLDVSSSDIPYHLNIHGEYSITTDIPVYVKSLDDGTDILFSRTSLQNHPKTLNTYRNDDKLLWDLILQNLPSALTIRSAVLDFVVDDFSTLVDGEIIYYDSAYICFNEYTLMDSIQEYIYDTMNRWYVRNYNINNPLYLGTFLSLLISMIGPHILNLREDRLKSYETHKFHVRQYLLSNGIIDTSIDYLTHQQQMFLYRNMEHLKRISGTNQVLDLLVDGLYKPNDLPLSSFELTLVNIDGELDLSNPDKWETPTVRHQFLSTTLSGRGTSHATLPKEKYYGYEDTLGENNLVTYPVRDKKSLLNGTGLLQTGLLLTSIGETGDNIYYTLDEYVLDNALFMSETSQENVSVRGVTINSRDGLELLLGIITSLRGNIDSQLTTVFTVANILRQDGVDYPFYVENRLRSFISEMDDLLEPWSIPDELEDKYTLTLDHYETFKRLKTITTLPTLVGDDALLESRLGYYLNSFDITLNHGGSTLGDILTTLGVDWSIDTVQSQSFISDLFLGVTGHSLGSDSSLTDNLRAVNTIVSGFLPYDVEIVEDSDSTVSTELTPTNMFMGVESDNSLNVSLRFPNGDFYFDNTSVTTTTTFDYTTTDDYFNLNEPVFIQPVYVRAVLGHVPFGYDGRVTAVFNTLANDTVIEWTQIGGTPVVYTTGTDGEFIEFTATDLEEKVFRVTTNPGTLAERSDVTSFYHHPLDMVTPNGETNNTIFNPDYPEVVHFAADANSGMVPVDTMATGYSDINALLNNVSFNPTDDRFNEIILTHDITEEGRRAIRSATLMRYNGSTWVVEAEANLEIDRILFLAIEGTTDPRKIVLHLRRYGYEWFVEVPVSGMAGGATDVIDKEVTGHSTVDLTTLISKVSTISKEDYINLNLETTNTVDLYTLQQRPKYTTIGDVSEVTIDVTMTAELDTFYQTILTVS